MCFKLIQDEWDVWPRIEPRSSSNKNPHVHNYDDHVLKNLTRWHSGMLVFS